MPRFGFSIVLSACSLFTLLTLTQACAGANVDESKVGKLSLPPLLVLKSGRPVVDADMWSRERRPELFELFETQVYGRVPKVNPKQVFETIETDPNALNGLATRKQIAIVLGEAPNQKRVELLIYLPNNIPKPIPMFVGLNFQGNHTIHADPAVKLTPNWVHNHSSTKVTDHRANDSSRGCEAEAWPVEMILKRGYGLATVYYGDLDPDFDDGFKNGVHPLILKSADGPPAPDEPGSIGAWAWGLSRAMDYLQADSDIDAKRVAVIGHSRLGKTSLWAGAQDSRFALVISNESGCGGAALSRRDFGETVDIINTRFPHWFCDNFNQYNNREADLPVDQHMLIALIAPRPVYVASATQDLWSDPRGEFLAAKYAEPVYALFGKEGMSFDEAQQPRLTTKSSIGYHNRPGAHDILPYDWERYLNFADLHLRK